MNRLLEEILSYLDHLNGQCGLQVSVHFGKEKLNRMPESVLTALGPYNTHRNPYCIMVKRNEEEHRKCLRSQQVVLQKCKKCGSFCGVCHAGVYECLYPIYEDSAVVGYAAVSGYRKKAPPENMADMELWRESLNPEEIPRTLCDTLIPPLCRMLELLFLCPPNSADADPEYNLIFHYINEHHNRITLSEICLEFGRSRSYISHMFKSRCGVSIRAYCNRLKLEDAKNLLDKTDLPITEIALDVGFGDVSYFIQLFRERFSMTPLQYRKRHFS
ncbi:MAG TPA: AraC family transcriptional regulator [Candidatus Eisenbergiella merdipullorum]|uniref:AraC family transcriptional regulator n=1 Tax=Candidatus Eisenbergiella merdipullorum TaxID=2838553 RepID=A0A9D2I2S2_9FIRM|nr:AraC family transcriptional regulator [Candidatus Eisenbergiella merdipullorum]